jgi:hypothetical protein
MVKKAIIGLVKVLVEEYIELKGLMILIPLGGDSSGIYRPILHTIIQSQYCIASL